jgi:hypothetical protein
MCTPSFNQIADRSLLIEAMQTYSFAILFGPQSTPEAAAPLEVTQKCSASLLAGCRVDLPVHAALYTNRKNA